jgi:hypothetical protein
MAFESYRKPSCLKFKQCPLSIISNDPTFSEHKCWLTKCQVDKTGQHQYHKTFVSHSRTIMFMVLFSQYLRDVQLPCPSYNKVQGLHLTRTGENDIKPFSLSLMLTQNLSNKLVTLVKMPNLANSMLVKVSLQKHFL